MMECVSPARNKWRIRWDVQLRDDGSASYMEEEFTHKPSEEEVRQTIVSWFNARTEENIRIRMEWYEGMVVSREPI